MPELPEVQTTVDGLNKKVKGLTIEEVRTDYFSHFHTGADNIKDPKFFAAFKRQVKNKKILKAERRAKNILIHLHGNKTILIHMKMTGHLMYGMYEYKKKENKWISKEKNSPLSDPFNQFLHLVFTFTNKKQLAFSDMRRFAKVTLIDTDKLTESSHLKNLGPEPLDKNFQLEIFSSQLMKKPKGKIKQVLMDQSVISGIGNIYSDEILWRANTHPLSIVNKIPEKEIKLMFKATLETLKKGINFGGDSTSDYRNIEGIRGTFHAHHNAYQMHNKKCKKPGCPGVLKRIVIGARSAHFCPAHQTLFR
jgi:formamidopyrimidine-DNA glycosylase